jgi:predicted O-methyltransferase YrrM
LVAQFRTSSEDASRFATIYKTVLTAYEELGYPAEIVNTWAIGHNDAPDLMAIAESVNPSRILEVGTYVGVSTMLIALACPGAHIFTVDPDLPLKIEMGATGSSVANVDSSATTHAIARAAAEKLGVADRITFVKGGYSVRETFSSTLTSKGSKAKLAGPKLCKDEGPFDFIFIDGLHTAEAVAADLQLSAKHLTPTGIMALHDCIGFWGANVRAGVLEFIRRNPSYRFMHPPYADLWRTVGIVAPADSKRIDLGHFAGPMTKDAHPEGLGETFGALLASTFGGRDILEVSVGEPLLKSVAAPGRHVSVRVLAGRGGRNLNAELDRILTQFDKLDSPVLFSADLLDFSPPELTQNLLAAVAHRKGELMLAVTPPGEEGIAGPESRPAGWLVSMARAHRFAAYGLPQLDLEPARYSLLPEMRELGRNSRFASTVVIAPRGGFVDAKRRKLVELTPSLAAEREQSELQRVHLASGYRRFFKESHASYEAGQREKRWREENTESLNGQIARLTEDNQRIAARDQTLSTKLASRDATLAALTSQLQTAREAGEREKFWREEAAASHQVQITQLLEQNRGLLAREAALRAQNEASIELARLESELRVGKEARLRKMIDELAAGDRERDAVLQRAFEAKTALELELTRVEEERRASVVREAVLQNQLKDFEGLKQLASRMKDVRAESDEYLGRLVDIYDAMDSFDALVSEGEALLGDFERDVLGMPVPQLDAAADRSESSNDLDPTNTIAEIERLKGRWRSILLRFGHSRETGAARVQVLTNERNDLERRLVETSQVLDQARESGKLRQRVAYERDDAEQRLIEVYEALDEIDAAVAEQLRMCNETEAQLFGGSVPADEVVHPDDNHDPLILLRQRSRVLSGKIARLLGTSQSRFLTAEETSRNLQSHTAALELQIRDIRTSTSWRALAPVRVAGKPVRVMRRRVGAKVRGRALLKLKADLDSRLKPMGLECPVFDAPGYAQRYGDVPAHLALRHYLSFGENEGRLPLHSFDPAFYYRMYPDVQTARASALLHFLKFGVHEGRSPCAALHPLGALAAEKGISPLEYFARS